MAKRKEGDSALTPEQLTLRKTGIGGSEIAAVAGLSPWKGPLDVYLEKTGQADAYEAGQAARRGNIYEPAIRVDYADTTGNEVVDSVGTLIHPKYPIVLATPDGIVRQTGSDWAVLEIKRPARTWHHWGEAGTDEIPEYYQPQVCWEMACAGLAHAEVAALIFGELRIYHVRFDRELWQVLLDIAQDFWQHNVVARVPPDLDGTAGSLEWIRKQYPEVRRDMLPASNDVDQWATRLQEIQAMRADLDAGEREAKANLIQLIGEHEGTEGHWGRITYRQSKGRRTVDWQALAKELGATDKDIERHTKQAEPIRTFKPQFTGGG